MKINRALAILCVLITMVISNGYSQGGLSPYSQLGIGDIQRNSLIQHNGMGGLGISNGSSFYMNTLNPALLPYNRLTVYEVSWAYTNRSYQQGDATASSDGGNINYLSTAFPGKRGIWTFGFGLGPYSTVQYDFSRQSTIPGTSIISQFSDSGTGGINQANLSAGVNLGAGISVGLKFAYLFGSIKKETSNFVNDPASPPIYVPVLFDRLSVSDIQLGLGLAYAKKLNEDLSLNLGFVFDRGSEIKARQFQSIETRLISGTSIAVDTLQDDVRGNIDIPNFFGFGASLRKGLKWTIGADVHLQNWGDYSNFGGTNPDFKESMKLILGGEFTPDVQSTESYWERVTYRLGLNYHQTPYIFNQQEIDEFGINFGLTMPVSRFSSLNFAFGFGARGNTDNDLIRDQFYQIQFGITFNDQWFIKRVYD